MSNENGCYKIYRDLRDVGADGAWNWPVFSLVSLLMVASYAAFLMSSREGALRDDTKNACVGGYFDGWNTENLYKGFLFDTQFDTQSV